MKRIFYIFFIAAILVLIYFLTNDRFFLNSQNPESAMKKTSPQITSSANKTLENKSITEDSESDASLGDSNSFEVWYDLQSKEVERSSLEPQQLEDSLRTKSRTLNESEKKYIVAKILEPQSPANEKILGAYLLSLEPSLNFMAAQEVIISDLFYPANSPQHSPEETLGMQEKTIRRILIDSIYEQAKTQTSARDQLKQLQKSAKSAYIRDYIAKKLKTLP